MDKLRLRFKKTGRAVYISHLDLLQTSESLREEREAANAPKIKVTCPVCGATTLPDANGCCEFCGSPVK